MPIFKYIIFIETIEADHDMGQEYNDMCEGQGYASDMMYELMEFADDHDVQLSLVADAFRILVRGGVFLYPQDDRKGYEKGRLRLVYEANPVSYLIEQAGGVSINGSSKILSLKPQTLHERIPLMFGSKNEIAKIKIKMEK